MVYIILAALILIFALNIIATTLYMSILQRKVRTQEARIFELNGDLTRSHAVTGMLSHHLTRLADHSERQIVSQQEALALASEYQKIAEAFLSIRENSDNSSRSANVHTTESWVEFRGDHKLISNN